MDNNQTFVLDISSFILRAECIGANNLEDLSYLCDDIHRDLGVLYEFMESQDSGNIKISVECTAPKYEKLISKTKLNEIGNAITYALEDLKNTDSYIFKDIIIPFIAHKNQYNSKRFYLECVITGIIVSALKGNIKGIGLSSNSENWEFEGCYKNKDYFRFTFPSDRCIELWNEVDYSIINDLQTNPGDFNLWEFGINNIVYYILGPYYYHFATYFSDVELLKSTHIYEWYFGRA